MMMMMMMMMMMRMMTMIRDERLITLGSSRDLSGIVSGSFRDHCETIAEACQGSLTKLGAFWDDLGVVLDSC